MKKILHLITALFLVAAGIYAQNGFSYQTVVRNSNGNIYAETPVSFRFSVREQSLNGPVIYTEEHHTGSSKSGYIQLTIGEGTAISGSFDNINWSAGELFLQTECKINSGNYVDMGTSRLLYTPYGKYAERAGEVKFNQSENTYRIIKAYDDGTLYTEEMIEQEVPCNDCPERLYLVGTFCNWQPQESLSFNKVSNGIFELVKTLENGEIFKFIQVQDWTQNDWSGTSGAVNTEASLKHAGDTPNFPGSTGNYKIRVNFNKFTLLITPI